MTVYAPGTQERDPSKQNMALQQQAAKIATNTAAIATLNGATYVNSIAGQSGTITVSHGLTNSGNDIQTVISAAQTFLGSDVSLNDTTKYFDGPATGSIGASGQTWLIVGVVSLRDTAIASVLVRIWDGSSVFKEVSGSVSVANADNVVTIVAVVTPSAAASYRVSVKDRSNTTGKILTTGSAGTANKASSITAIRLL